MYAGTQLFALNRQENDKNSITKNRFLSTAVFVEYFIEKCDFMLKFFDKKPSTIYKKERCKMIPCCIPSMRILNTSLLGKLIHLVISKNLTGFLEVSIKKRIFV